MVRDNRPSKMITNAKGTFGIISYLYRHRETCLTKLIRNVDASQKTVYRAIEILLSLELVSEEETTTFPKRKVYALTSKGRILVEGPLYKWNQVLNGFVYPGFRKSDQRKSNSSKAQL